MPTNVIQLLAGKNDEKYNLLKTLEECIELSEVLIKMTTKKEPHKPPLSKLFEEMAHVEIRLKILRAKFGDEGVDEEYAKKLDALYNYVKSGKYSSV